MCSNTDGGTVVSVGAYLAEVWGNGGGGLSGDGGMYGGGGGKVIFSSIMIMVKPKGAVGGWFYGTKDGRWKIP